MFHYDLLRANSDGKVRQVVVDAPKEFWERRYIILWPGESDII